MAIGLVSDDAFLAELESFNKKESHVKEESHVVEAEIVRTPSRGRSDGETNVPESLRKIIGEESVINGRASALQLAADLGISPSSVSAYAKGATSTTTYDTPNKSLISHINKSRARHIKRASSVLSAAMKAITQEKLDYTDAKDLSGIAKDMAVIIKSLEPAGESAGESAPKTPQFVIYAPSFKKEETFEFINVQE